MPNTAASNTKPNILFFIVVMFNLYNKGLGRFVLTGAGFGSPYIISGIKVIN
jgi:hypothetical protein